MPRLSARTNKPRRRVTALHEASGLLAARIQPNTRPTFSLTASQSNAPSAPAANSFDPRPTAAAPARIQADTLASVASTPPVGSTAGGQQPVPGARRHHRADEPGPAHGLCRKHLDDLGPQLFGLRNLIRGGTYLEIQGTAVTVVTPPTPQDKRCYDRGLC